MSNHSRVADRIVELAQQQAQPVLQMVQPLNDIQLVALIAAHRTDLPAVDAVTWANDVLFQAVLQAPAMHERIKKHMEAKQRGGLA